VCEYVVVVAAMVTFAVIAVNAYLPTFANIIEMDVGARCRLDEPGRAE